MGAYIFLGPELGKKQDAVKLIKERFKNNKETEEFVFYADETPAGEIIDTLKNQGLFADSRIVIVKNAEQIKKKNDIDLLVSCIKTLEENTVLILLSDETKIAAGFDGAKANRQIFWEMFENEKVNWVRDFFRREGFSISNDCIDTVLELVENNTDALKRDCNHLVNFLSKGKPVSAEDIEKWLSHNREESAFTLFSRIAAGDLCKALESLSIMLAAKESASGILAGLAWCFRKLNDYLELTDSGNENNSIELKKIGLSSSKIKSDYIAASNRYNTDDAETCLALTAEYGNLLRSPVAPMEKILMDRYVLALINTGKK